MAGHIDPVELARLIAESKTFDTEAREFLDAADRDKTTYYDVGVNTVLVVLPGWGPFGDPADFLRLAYKAS